MTARRRHLRLIALIALALFDSGCSSKQSAATPSTAFTAATAAVTSPTPTAPTSVGPTTPDSASAGSAPSSSSTAASPPADDKAAITAAFTTFFDGLDPNTNAKIAVLQNGELLGSMVVDAAQNPQFQQLTTTVNSVDLLSDADCSAAGEVAPCALVHHDLFVGGLPAMVDLKSHAVRVNGTWQVSSSSWCAVVTIGGATCPTLPKG